MTTETIPEENKILTDRAKTMYISNPEASYAIFCWNSQGDLFMNSDWGFYAYSWRAFGNDFNEFLTRLNAQYLVEKLSMNWHVPGNKLVKFNGRREQMVTKLCTIFIEELRKV